MNCFRPIVFKSSITIAFGATVIVLSYTILPLYIRSPTNRYQVFAYLRQLDPQSTRATGALTDVGYSGRVHRQYFPPPPPKKGRKKEKEQLNARAEMPLEGNAHVFVFGFLYGCTWRWRP